jgi:hypothetical protein
MDANELPIVRELTTETVQQWLDPNHLGSVTKVIPPTMKELRAAALIVTLYEALGPFVNTRARPLGVSWPDHNPKTCKMRLDVSSKDCSAARAAIEEARKG